MSRAGQIMAFLTAVFITIRELMSTAQPISRGKVSNFAAAFGKKMTDFADKTRQQSTVTVDSLRALTQRASKSSACKQQSFTANGKTTEKLQTVDFQQPGLERVQALADISRSAVCCHSKKTRAPIANPPNSAQLEGTPYYSSNIHPGPCTVVWECGEGQTDRHTNGRDHYKFRLGYASREM